MCETGSDLQMFARGSLEVLSGIYAYWGCVTYFNKQMCADIMRQWEKWNCPDVWCVVQTARG